MDYDRHRFVYTRKIDRGVSIGIPAPNCIRAMQFGGFWGLMPQGFIAEQIERQVRGNIPRDAATAFALAVGHGGLTYGEAIATICRRDCGHLGDNIDIVDKSEVPSDRWFRDAWSRSPNGGPISIDMKKARRVQISRVYAAVEAENVRRRRRIFARRPLKVSMITVARAISHARDEDELRRVWPDGLPSIVA